MLALLPGLRQSSASTDQEDATRSGGALDTLQLTGKSLVRNTVINLGGRVLPLIVALAAMPYTVHHLGPDRFGILSLAWVVTGYFALFDLGIGSAVTKFVAELLGRGETSEVPELIWSAVVSQLCLGAMAGLLLAAITPLLVERVLKIPVGIQPQAHLVFLILAASLPISFAAGSLGGVLSASQRFDLLNAVGIPSSALNYLLPVVALAMGFGLPTIVLFLALARLASLVVTYFLCLRLYPSLNARIGLNGTLIRRLVGFGSWVTVSGAIGPVLVYFDRFLIGALISVAAVGFYTPPYMISTKLWILPSSLALVLFPAFSTSASRGDNAWVTNAMVRSTKFLLLLVGPAILVMIFFAHPLLALWLGGKFADEGSAVLQILSVGVLTNSLAYVPYNLLYGLGRPDLPAKFHLAETPLHVALAWLLVVRFGIPGAALAWTIRNTLDLGLLVAGACKVTGTSPRILLGSSMRRGGTAVGALGMGLGVLWALRQALFVDVSVALILVSTFSLAAWSYVLDPEEKWRIRLCLGLAR